MSSNRIVSDPRDHILAVLALVKMKPQQAITPNYDWSTSQTYTAAMRAMLSNGGMQSSEYSAAVDWPTSFDLASWV